MIRYTADNLTQNNQEVEVRIGDAFFSGSPQKLKGTGSGWLRYTHQNLNPRRTIQNPIQRGELRVTVWIQTQDHRDFREQVTTAQEGRFTMELYLNGELEWKGYVLPDLCQYSEEIPERFTITAKDFTLLRRSLFPVENVRQPIISTIERILDDLEFDLDIITSTSFTQTSIPSGEDYLRNIFHTTQPLRDLASDGDIPINNEEALRRILTSHGLIIKQTGGAFRIDQITAYESANSVLRSQYNNGFVSQGTVNTRYTPSPITIGSSNQGNPGLKRIFNTFEHRTQSTLREIPESILLSPPDTLRSFNFDVIPQGDELIRLETEVFVRHIQPIAQAELNNIAYVELLIQAGQYYWNGSAWQTGFTTLVTDLFSIGITEDLNNRTYEFTNQISVETDEIPSDATADVQIQFRSAQIGLEFGVFPPIGRQTATQTNFRAIEFEIANFDDADNSQSISYKLEQIGDFTEEYTHPNSYWGDGPTQSSPSALRFLNQAESTTNGGWQRRGSTQAVRSFTSNLLHEILDVNRSWRRVLNAQIKGEIEPYNTVFYEDTDFFYIGGTFDGWTGDWNVQLLQIFVQDQEEQLAELVRERLSQFGSSRFINLTVTDLKRLFGTLNAVGELAEDLDDEVDSALMRLDNPVRVGYEYWIINVDELSTRDRFAGIYPFLPVEVSEAEEYGPGELSVPIEETLISAPKGSLIVKAPGQDEIEVNITDERVREGEERLGQLDEELDLLDEKLDELDDELENLNDTVLPNLQTELNTLDGYFDDPSTIPSGYNFFEGIVAENIFVNSLVARELFTDTLAANQVFTDKLVANQVFTDELVANDVFTDTLRAKTAWIEDMTAAIINVGDLYAREATIGAKLTLGSGGEFTNTNGDFVINADGFFISDDAEFDIVLGSDGMITNTNNDFWIDSDGFAVEVGGAFSNRKSYKFVTSGGTEVGYIFSTGGVTEWRTEDGYNIQIRADGRVRIMDLPTSSTGVTDALYTQTASQLGGSGTTKVICITG